MHSKSFTHLSRLLTISVLSMVLMGCFGDGDGPQKIPGLQRDPVPPVLKVGVLVNTEVTGATWESSGGESGLTEDGEYPYFEGETVTFSVGDITLGVFGVTVDSAALLTPVELTGSLTPLAQAATNMFVFLQTIDENSPNSADGIQISQATRDAFAGQSLNFDSDSATFTDDFQDLLDAVLPDKTIVSEEDALGSFCEETYLPEGGESTFGYPFPGCALSGGTVELLTNGGFELPDASGGDIACSFSWDCFNSSFTNSNLFDDGNGGPPAHSGTQILKQYDDDGGAFQDVPAIPGETYTASIWAQSWSGDALNRLVLFQLFFLDSSGGILEQNETFGTPITPPAAENQTYLPPDIWVELSIERVAPANTATARIQVIHLKEETNQTGDPGGSVFLDDASLIGPFSDVPEGFQLVFSDEFNDAGPPDPIKWTAETGNGPPDNPVGFGNNEWQEYTMNLDNLRVEDGYLWIQARCETVSCISETADPGNGSITSGKVATKDKFEFQNGIVRAKIKASGGFAAWPAFWMLGFDYPVTPWPNAGEMDIMELFQNNSSPFTTHSTIHFCNDDLSLDPCNFDNGWTFLGGSKTAAEAWSDDFHIYELEWTDDLLIFRVDGSEVFTQVINPDTMEEFRKPYYLILNLAMGGNLGPGGNQLPDPNNTFVHTSLIDWVRVYQPVP